MADHLPLATSVLWVVNLLGQLTVLVLELRTYRRTRHSSLLILALAGALAVLYLALSFVAGLATSGAILVWRLYLAAVVVFILQLAIGIWGIAWLFRAFSARHAQAGSETDRSSAGSLTPGAEPEQQAGDKGWAATLACVFRLWTLRAVANLPVVASERSVALLGALSLTLWIGGGWLLAGPGSSFNVYGIPSFGAAVLMLLVLAFSLARRSRPPLPYRQSLFIIVALLPMLIVLDALAEYGLGRWAFAADLVLVIYGAIYAWRALHTFSGARQPRAVLVSLALLCAFIWIEHTVSIVPSLWSPKEPESAADPSWQPGINESLLFDQQRRIDAALGTVAAGDGSTSSVFFVGFAGVASQKVFAEEIKLASRVVDSRYDTAHRQLLLINDRRDLQAYPLATVSGLHYALSGVARKMNLQQDILFLSLSSHGSAEPELSVSNGGLDLEQVTDENLLQALRDAGIRWRIIVISACHAGAFIHKLQDPGTIIITAAAPDRTSFGCSDDRDLTYFGEAFYRDALPRAHSLDEAFSLAKAAIARREAAEHITPSQPQAYFGADLERLLALHPMREAGAVNH
jgi:hypothetical protein